MTSLPGLSGLDQEMRSLLLELAACSHVPAANPNPGSRSTDDKIGGSRPPGDLGQEEVARAYGPPFAPLIEGSVMLGGLRTHQARSDHDRRQVIEIARDELRSIKGRERKARPAGESSEQSLERALSETVGMDPRQASTTRGAFFGMTERAIRSHRRRSGRDAETGDQTDPVEQPRKRGGEFEPEVRRLKAHELKEQGMPLSSIALRLGADKATIIRDLGKAA